MARGSHAIIDQFLGTSDEFIEAHARAASRAVHTSVNRACYDDDVEIEKRKDLFINSDQAKGGYRPNIPADPAIIGLDDPLHQRRRGLVSRRFAPKAVAVWTDTIRVEVTRLLDTVKAADGYAEIMTPGTEPVEMPNAFVYGLRSAHLDLEFA